MHEARVTVVVAGARDHRKSFLVLSNLLTRFLKDKHDAHFNGCSGFIWGGVQQRQGIFAGPNKWGSAEIWGWKSFLLIWSTVFKYISN